MSPDNVSGQDADAPSAIDPEGVLPELPASWQTVTLGGLGSTSSFYGPRFSTEDYVSEGVPTVRTTDMDFQGRINLTDSPKVRVPHDEMRRFGLEDGDILVMPTVPRSGNVPCTNRLSALRSRVRISFGSGFDEIWSCHSSSCYSCNRRSDKRCLVLARPQSHCPTSTRKPSSLSPSLFHWRNRGVS